MKPGKVVLVLAGRYSGRKAVIVKVSAGPAAPRRGGAAPGASPGRSRRAGRSPERRCRLFLEASVEARLLLGFRGGVARRLALPGAIAGCGRCVSEHRRWHF